MHSGTDNSRFDGLGRFITRFTFVWVSARVTAAPTLSSIHAKYNLKGKHIFNRLYTYTVIKNIMPYIYFRCASSLFYASSRVVAFFVRALYEDNASRIYLNMCKRSTYRKKLTHGFFLLISCLFMPLVPNVKAASCVCTRFHAFCMCHTLNA